MTDVLTAVRDLKAKNFTATPVIGNTGENKQVIAKTSKYAKCSSGYINKKNCFTFAA